eukprot:403348255
MMLVRTMGKGYLYNLHTFLLIRHLNEFERPFTPQLKEVIGRILALRLQDCISIYRIDEFDIVQVLVIPCLQNYQIQFLEFDDKDKLGVIFHQDYELKVYKLNPEDGDGMMFEEKSYEFRFDHLYYRIKKQNRKYMYSVIKVINHVAYVMTYKIKFGKTKVSSKKVKKLTGQSAYYQYNFIDQDFYPWNTHNNFLNNYQPIVSTKKMRHRKISFSHANLNMDQFKILKISKKFILGWINDVIILLNLENLEYQTCTVNIEKSNYEKQFFIDNPIKFNTTQIQSIDMYQGLMNENNFQQQNLVNQQQMQQQFESTNNEEKQQQNIRQIRLQKLMQNKVQQPIHSKQNQYADVEMLDLSQNNEEINQQQNMNKENIHHLGSKIIDNQQIHQLIFEGADLTRNLDFSIVYADNHGKLIKAQVHFGL